LYRLVSDGTIRNTRSEYVQLAQHTAEARRQGVFPELLDRRPAIHRYRTFESVKGAQGWLRTIYRRDRTASSADCTDDELTSLQSGFEDATRESQLATLGPNMAPCQEKSQLLAYARAT